MPGPNLAAALSDMPQSSAVELPFSEKTRLGGGTHPRPRLGSLFSQQQTPFQGQYNKAPCSISTERSTARRFSPFNSGIAKS